MELPGSLGAGTKALVVLAAVVVVAFGVKAAASVLTPLMFAALLAAAMAPVVALLQRMKIPTALAVTLTVLVILGVLVGLGALVSLAASDLTDSLPRLEASVFRLQRQVVLWLESQGLARVAAAATNFDARDLGSAAVTGIVLGMPAVLSSFAVVFFVTVFILLESTTFRSKLHRALQWQPERYADARHAIGEVQKYLFAKTVTSAITGLLVGGWCFVVGLDNSVLWGLLTFLLNYIPVFGSIVATVLATASALVQLQLANGLVVLTGLTIINMLIGYLLEPRVLGRAVGLSPLVVVVSIVFWGWVLGPLGALLSVPLTMVVKIVLAHTEDLRWVSVLLGPGEGKHEEEYALQRRLTRLARVSDAPPSSTPFSAPPESSLTPRPR